MAAETADAIIAALTRGAARAPDLQRALGVSQPTLSRAMGQLGDRVIRMGRGPGTRYALRHQLSEVGSSWPVFAVSEHGKASPLGKLHALASEQYWFASTDDRHSLLTDGIPYFLHDLWPQGFIGRTVPRRYPELGLPDRVQDWNDAHLLTYLTRRGDDSIGNFIVGDESFQRYLRDLQSEPRLIELRERDDQFPALADAAIGGTVPGSSAGGEHPKFTAMLRIARSADMDRDVRPVLVKFSPAGTDRVSRRWSDLLIAEHLASRALAASGLPAVTSTILMSRGRTFLEVERFDRTGLRGRRGMASFAAITNHYIGSRDDWTTAARKLASLHVISGSAAETINKIATFGRLIANTDMHFGNLSFFHALGEPLELAPVYDMLPMLYAPVGADELPERRFEVPLPSADNLEIWAPMADLAREYWKTVAAHELVSRDFADIASQNAKELERVTRAMARVA
jgi:hypothetical protein